jgi:hypothetical protein
MSRIEWSGSFEADRGRHHWFPWIVLAIAAGVSVVLLLIPTENFDRGIRNSALMVVAAAGGLALVLWLLLGSGMAGQTRLLLGASLAAVGVALILAIDHVEYSGDMHPTIVWRFGGSRASRLESHRQHHASDVAAFRAEQLVARAGDCPEYRGLHRDGVVPDPPTLARDWNATPPKLLWKQPVGGGYAGFIVVGPLLATIEQRRDQEAVVAYDAETGRERWLVEYPALFHETLGGDGRELWRVAWTTSFDINAAQPLLVGPNRLLISSDTGVVVIEVAEADSRWSAKELWRNNLLKCSYANPLLYGGHVYGLNKGILTCLDLATGKRRWQGGRYGHGQMLLCGDLIVILAESGELVLVEATPEAHRELGRIQAIEGKTWNNPTMVGNRIYVRNHIEMAAFDLPTAPAAENPTPP